MGNTENSIRALECAGQNGQRVGWSFGAAISALQRGQKVYREGWNGKGMFLYLHEFTNADFLPCIVMFTAQGKQQFGWLASQADMLAHDWWVMA